MDEREALRVGLVGCGFHGGNMAQAVFRSDRLRLVACADPDDDATHHIGDLAAGAGQPDGVSRHGSLDAMLSEADIGAVVIATPHHMLAPLSLAAIRAGKHVLVEKPMALDEARAREVEFAAASAGVTCMVGYSFRFGPCRFVHDLIEQGAVGDIRAITGSIGAGRMDDGWVASREFGGGPLLYVGCHVIDSALWFAAEEPTSVWASVHERPETGVDDTSMLHLEFSHDRVGQFLVTQSAAGFFFELQVVGQAGSITLRGHNFVQFEIEVWSDALPAYAEPTFIRPNMWRDHITMMLMPELAEFADAVGQNRPPGITASDGRRVLRVIDAALESGRTGQAMNLAPLLAAY
jgi:predicted dehydrogenase